MKKLLFIALLIVVASCKKEEKVKDNGIVNKDKYADLYGNWVGDFNAVDYDTLIEEGSDFNYSNKINLLIKKIENDKVYGLSIVAGNSRSLVGEFTEYNGEYRFILKEPGDKKNDGQFKFTISNDTLKGNWTINNKNAKMVWTREYKLTKQPFEYNAKAMLPIIESEVDDEAYIDWDSGKTDSVSYKNDDGKDVYYQRDMYRYATNIVTKINASTTLLKETDVKNLKKLELEIIRNTIFARHGYTFKKKSFRQFFDPVAWYIPVTDDMSGKLTLTEQKNIVLLNRFQKYAEDNYDSFGR